MSTGENSEKYNNRLKELEAKLSNLKFELEDVKQMLEEEQSQRQFYQLVADFTFGWELWLEPGGTIKYCSPSCFDLTGFTSNQVIAAESLANLLVYEPDRTKFNDFVAHSINHLLMNQALEFRILTRHKQLRWCSINVRGVYNKKGRYLGIRASVQDITKLKRAMGHIHDLSEEKDIEHRAKLRFKSQLENKDRELISFLLQLSQKNEVIALATKQLKKMVGGNSKNLQQKVNELLQMIENLPSAPVNWDMVEFQMEKLHPGFLGRLPVKHSNLTPKEKKLCAYLRLGLSSKEISGLLNIAAKSVEVARGRLRKKLKLEQGMRLVSYINEI
ncbi:MAG TPA: LuxR C-terminal-related transcriptional regulator [Draconibacterium sp.]|nr:LuxR C-terminal-related transcriptional regulator [Draconibacterium sp.]